jgi:hypothetical protein
LLQFLDRFNYDLPPKAEEVSEIMKSVKAYHMRFLLNQILLQNSYKALLVLLPYMLEYELIDAKLAVSATQGLARAWIQLGPNDRIKSLSMKLRPFVSDDQLSDGLRVLLDVCAEKWPIVLTGPEQILLFKDDCFNALVVAALRNSDFRQLMQILEQFPSKMLFRNPDVLQVFVSFVKSNNFLVGMFLQHLEGQVITEETFQCIKQVAL